MTCKIRKWELSDAAALAAAEAAAEPAAEPAADEETVKE